MRGMEAGFIKPSGINGGRGKINHTGLMAIHSIRKCQLNTDIWGRKSISTTSVYACPKGPSKYHRRELTIDGADKCMRLRPQNA